MWEKSIGQTISSPHPLGICTKKTSKNTEVEQILWDFRKK